MKKYIDLLLINLIFLFIGIFLFFFVNKRFEIIGAVIATGISLSLGIRQYKTENDKIFKKLFVEFNSRYDEKFKKDLETIISKYEIDKNYKLDSYQQNLIVEYLNFCAEEYLWRTKDRIPNNVWKSWEAGMVYYFNNPLINEIFFQEKDQKNSYYGFFEKISKKIKKLF
jgi:hypothetical protein